MTSLEPRSSTRNLLCSKTRNCCYKGHKGRRGLAEGLDVLHGSFRGPLEANGPYEAGLCDLQGHRGRILTFCMTSEASRGRGVCGRAEFLKKDSFKKRKDYSASHATNQSGWPYFFWARFKNLENLWIGKIGRSIFTLTALFSFLLLTYLLSVVTELIPHPPSTLSCT